MTSKEQIKSSLTIKIWTGIHLKLKLLISNGSLNLKIKHILEIRIIKFGMLSAKKYAKNTVVKKVIRKFKFALRR